MRQILEQLVPVLYERREEKRIRLRLRAKENKIGRGDGLDESWKRFRALDAGDLKEALASELNRRDGFQRRALGFLGTVAVMSAFVIGAVSLLRTSRHAVPSAVTTPLVVLTLVYLGLAAWGALRIVSPGRLYDLNLHNRMPGQERLTEEAWKDIIIQAIELNEASNLILAYQSERTSRSLQNGIVCLVASLVAVVVDSAL